MNESTLLSIKKRISLFNEVVRPIANLWSLDHYTTISVMVQNMAFSGKGTESYDYRQEIDKLYQYLKCLKSLSEYYNSHFENWIYQEIDMIIMGEVQCEGLN